MTRDKLNHRHSKRISSFLGLSFFRDKVGLPECPYLYRWVADFKLFSIRIHKWVGSDDQRHPHDHPWWFITIPLYGCYYDITEERKEVVWPLRIRFRPAKHQHKVELISKTCWTLLITGKQTRDFGFWVDGKFTKRNRYFFDFKPHPCDNTEDHIR